jgi:hypothetical protein
MPVKNTASTPYTVGSRAAITSSWMGIVSLLNFIVGISTGEDLDKSAKDMDIS